MHVVLFLFKRNQLNNGFPLSTIRIHFFDATVCKNWQAHVIFISIILQFVCYKIDAIPLHVLGPIGQFVSYLANNHLKELRLG